MKKTFVLSVFLIGGSGVVSSDTNDTNEFIRRHQYETCILGCPTSTAHCVITSDRDEARQCREDVRTEYNFCVRQCRDRYN